MDKYKINIIYESNKSINEIFIKVLSKELKKNLNVTCNKQKAEVTSTCTRFSLKDKGGEFDVT